MGRTGIKVSPLCLGAMMFGAWGNPDHDESIRIIHRALDAGINFVDTADVYSARRVRGDRRQGARGPRATTSSSRPRCTARWATARTSAATRAAGSCARSRSSLRRLGTDWIDLYQIHRPEPGHRHRRDARRADRPRPRRARSATSAARPSRRTRSSRRSGSPSAAARERFVCEQPPYSMLVRGIERDVLPVCQQYGMGVIPWSPLAGGWLSGQVPQGHGDLPTSHARRPHPGALRPVAAREPAQARSRRRARQLADEAGMTLIHLALAFVHQHPGGDLGDHRAAHDGAAREPARRRRRRR